MEPQNQPMPTVSQEPDNIMPPPPQKSSKVWIVLTILLAISLIAVSVFGYYKWQQYRTLTGNLGAQINALQNQVKSLTATAVGEEVSSETYKVPSLGIKFIPSGELGNLAYFTRTLSNSEKVAYFSTSPLMTLQESVATNPGNEVICGPGAIGAIFVSPNAPTNTNGQPLPADQYVKVGNSYVSVTSPQNVCSTNKQVEELQNKQIELFKKSVLSSAKAL